MTWWKSLESLRQSTGVTSWRCGFSDTPRSSIRGQADQEASTQRQDDDSGSNRESDRAGSRQPRRRVDPTLVSVSG